MKQILLISIFLVLVVIGYSQDYHPIVKETNNWSVVSAGLGRFLKVCCVQTNHYRFEGDTTIQTTDYKKILLSTDSINQNWEIIGFIREDTIQKKVWLRDLENEEGLIYDFDLTLGKEVTLHNPFSNDTVKYLVTQIDSVLLQSGYRKVYKFGNEEQWIEGIGSKDGIINSAVSWTGGFRELLCFSDSNDEYINPKYQTCHKTSFTPLITNQYIDTAIVDQEYSFQINTSEIFYYDSIYFVDSLPYGYNNMKLPDGLHLNYSSGLISGIPKEAGVFPLLILLWNHDRVTDYLYTDLVVTQPSNVNLDNADIDIQLFPNPSGDKLTVKCHLNGSAYILTITDLTGKQVMVKTLTREYDIIGIGNLTRGVYLISVYDSNLNKKVLTDRLIKL